MTSTAGGAIVNRGRQLPALIRLESGRKLARELPVVGVFANLHTGEPHRELEGLLLVIV
jgi:hypothetical protein